LTGDLKGDAVKEPDGTLLPPALFRRGAWATRGIVVMAVVVVVVGGGSGSGRVVVASAVVVSIFARSPCLFTLACRRRMRYPVGGLGKDGRYWGCVAGEVT
jgi:hypothetical protein